MTLAIPVHYFDLIIIAGESASFFLQGQLTCDMREINETRGLFSACCDYKGRVIANFFVFLKDKDYYFLLPKSMVKSTIIHLKKYAAFSKVELMAANNIRTVKYRGSEIALKEIDENTWRLSNIETGFVWIYPTTSNILIPQMINLQKWGGVNFNKGCYIGQEIIARSEYIGKLKRHLYRANAVDSNKLAPGDELKNQNNQPVGVVVEAAKGRNDEYELLVVIQDHALGKAIALNQSHLKNIKKLLTS